VDAPANDCPRVAELAVVDNVPLPSAAGSMLVILFTCHRHLRDVRLWVDRRHPSPGRSRSHGTTLPARVAAASLRAARTMQQGERPQILTNLGRPAGRG